MLSLKPSWCWKLLNTNLCYKCFNPVNSSCLQTLGGFRGILFSQLRALVTSRKACLLYFLCGCISVVDENPARCQTNWVWLHQSQHLHSQPFFIIIFKLPVEEMIVNSSFKEGRMAEVWVLQILCNKPLTLFTCSKNSMISSSPSETHWNCPMHRMSCWQNRSWCFPVGMHWGCWVKSLLIFAHCLGLGLSQTFLSTSIRNKLKMLFADGLSRTNCSPSWI